MAVPGPETARDEQERRRKAFLNKRTLMLDSEKIRQQVVKGGYPEWRSRRPMATAELGESTLDRGSQQEGDAKVLLPHPEAVAQRRQAAGRTKPKALVAGGRHSRRASPNDGSGARTANAQHFNT